MLTEDKDNSEMYRFVIRSKTHKRPRPENSRFGGSITESLSKRAAKNGGSKEMNWIGESWMKEFNNGKLPSLN